MKVFIVVLLIVGLIVALVIVLPRRDGRPSEVAVAEAVFTHIRGLVPISPNLPLPDQWVEEVEVIAYGEPYTVQTSEGECTVWPVRVYLIDSQYKELKQVDLYRDELRQWQVLLIQDAS